jgi:uncharacterized repeat protein (TIGR01451 family)
VAASLSAAQAGGGVNAQFQGWLNLANQWGGTAQASNSKYSDGDTFPLRFTASLTPGTQHTVLLEYDFSSGGTARFFDSLGSYNTTVKSAALDLASGIAGAGAPTIWAIPSDASLPAGAQASGFLTTYNINLVTFGAYTLVNGVKKLPVTFTVAGTGSAKTVILGYGGHLASEITWLAGNGASQFPGASRKAFASLDGGSAANVSLNPGTVVASADLALTGSVAPANPSLGGQITYNFTVKNSGPDAASSVIVNDSLPAGLTFVSATTSQGTFSGTSALTFSLGTIAAGASANITIVVSTTQTGTVNNTGSVSSTVADPNSANNTLSLASTITDQTSPTIACPAPINVAADLGLCGAIVSFTVTATDNSGSATVSCNPPSGSTFPVGTTTVNCVATDPAGNKSACSFTVTVNDNQKPVITAPPAVVVNTDPTKCQASAVALGTPVTSDNCGIASVVNNAPAIFPKGTTVVTWTVTDSSGNQNTATQLVTVNDTELPLISAPAALELTTDLGKCDKSNVALGTPVTSDNCGITSVVNNAPAIFPKGTTLVTWTVTDTSGNNNTAVQPVTVKDTEPPSITAPAAITLDTDEGKCEASKVALGTPITFDNCGVASVVSNAPAVFPKGVTTVTWTVTDTSGNKNTAAQTVTVKDSEPPSITAPAAVTVSTDTGKCEASNVALGTPVTSDNCSVASVVSNAPAIFPKGVTTVTWTVTDTSGNQAAAFQSVTVNDTEKPAITAPPAVVANTDVGKASASNVTLGAPVTSDNCGVASVTSDAPLTFPFGTTTVTWTVTDISGNQTTTTQLVTVNDPEQPSITAPAAVTVSTDAGKCQAANVSLGAPVVSDNVGVAKVTNDAPAVFPKGVTTVTWTVTDTSGNQNTARQTVTVEDREGPVIACPGNLVVQFGAGGCSVASAFACPTANDNCDGPVDVICDPPATALLPLGDNLITCTAVDAAGNRSICTFTVKVLDSVNQSWPLAMEVPLQDPSNSGIQTGSAQECLTVFDQSRWFKFRVQPGSRIILTLENLRENYDLVLFKDIAAAYQKINSQDDLVRQSAAFASDAFSSAGFSQDAFAPGAFAPGAFAPGAFAPGAFAPGAFAPGAFAPGAFAPGAFAPDAFAPDAFAPGAFAPGAFAPGAFAPGAFAPGAFAPGAFAGAQLASVLAVSAFDGIANEGIIANSWDNDGYFYVRVKGRNGVFSPGNPFTLHVAQYTGSCGSVVSQPPVSVGSPLQGEAGGYKTIIITDMNRWLASEPSAFANAHAKLSELANAVGGVIVDVGADPVVAFFNAEADANFDCPYAKNLVAKSIRDIVNRYRTLNPLEYVVLVGNDRVIPFFRYPDEALLGPERNYVPPVKEATSSEASLRLNYVLSQDAYGADCELGLKTANLPLPDLAVGRLAENSDQVTSLIDTFLGSNGTLKPATSLVTGYDFLSDAAESVNDEFVASLGSSVTDHLISPNTLAPSLCWTADDLRAKLFGRRNDLVFLAGHFSAIGALAADYSTHVLASELRDSTNDFRNTLLFSAGCHSGYNIVNEDAIPFVTLDPDWVQACAIRGATLVAGTGYQYGDTDFIEYGERLYREFARQIRTGTGPISVGKALLRAKRLYLENTPALRPIHNKTYLQTTLFGLPMLAVDLPGPRRSSTPPGSAAVPVAVAQDPGATLGLKQAELTITPNLTAKQLTLTDPEQGTTVVATYLEGASGVINNPAEPILPLEVLDVAAQNLVLRGVGFRGGAYVDLLDKVPLTGAAATEIRGVHANFISEVFFPVRPWNVNYFGALCGSESQNTRLMAIPAQFKSDSPTAETGTIRQFSEMSFRLFYSGNFSTYLYKDGTQATPGAAAPPSLSGIQATTGDGGDRVVFSVRATGDPGAGMQSVWVTYTALSGSLSGLWQSLDLTQDGQDSTLWTGELLLDGVPSKDLRFMVQAVNGVGGVTLDTKLGAYYYPDAFDTGATAQLAPTSVAILTAQADAAYGTPASFSARLTDSSGGILAGKRMVFRLADQELWATTDATGVANVTFSILSKPGAYDFKASFPGYAGLAPSFATTPFTIKRQTTTLGLVPTGTVYVKPGADTKIIATLADAAGNWMSERTLFFLVSQGGQNLFSLPLITDSNGRIALGRVPLTAGSYEVNVYFNGTIPLPSGDIHIDDGHFAPSTTVGTIQVLKLVLDDQPPQITCPPDQLLTNDPGQCSAVATYAPAITDDHPGATVVCTPPSGSALPRGTNIVTCVVTDLAGNTNGCSFKVVVVDKEAPVIQCPADITVTPAPGQNTAVVPFNLTATDNCPEPVSLFASSLPGSAFPMGVTVVTCMATDASGNSSTCSFKVTVIDNVPPTISSISASPSVLSPPNHTMIPVTITVVASDNSGQPVTSYITSVSSSEPQNGTGDGDKSPDWEITGPLTVNLRSERAQSGPGRTYTITVACKDSSGNISTGTVTVFVPKNLSN